MASMSNTVAPLSTNTVAAILKSIRYLLTDGSLVMSPEDVDGIGLDDPVLAELDIPVATNSHLRRGEVYLVPRESWRRLCSLSPKRQADALRVASAMSGPDDAVFATMGRSAKRKGGGK